jgi:hypothetical protein
MLPFFQLFYLPWGHHTNESDLRLELSTIIKNGDFWKYFSGGDISFQGKIEGGVLRCND